MKKLIAVAGAALVSLSAFGQGTISFQNVGTGFDAKVLNSAGTAIGAGATITIELLAGTSAGNLVAFATPVMTSSWIGNGWFNVGAPAVALAGHAAGSFPFFQLRAWNNAGGTSYSAALAAGQAYNLSAVWQLVPGGGLSGLGNPSAVPPVPAPALFGMASYTLIPVPEPSVIALGVLGAAALLLRRRSRQ
jgi:hypothetical protein